MKLKKYIWVFAYVAFLIAFTAYCLLDTFVIVRVYGDDVGITATPTTAGEELAAPTDTPTDTTTTTKAPDNNVGGVIGTLSPETETTKTPSGGESVTANSYSDENISITLTEYREKNTSVYVADVKLSSISYLKTALANGKYGRNLKQKTSVQAKNNNAILAINGDFYGARSEGFVLRNGVLYRSTAASGRDCLVIGCDGTFDIVTEKSASALELLNSGALHILSFGPALIDNAEICVSYNDEVGQSMSSNPRTAIGIIEPLHYLLIVSDGRTKESVGLSLYELAVFMKELGVSTGYNLDGGGSATMYFNGQVINNPTTNGKTISEREVSDIVYIGY